MQDIKVNTYANWEAQTTIFGTSVSPLQIMAEIKNDSNYPFTITGICISIKSKKFLFSVSNDILYADKNDIANPNSQFRYSIDIRHILNNYDADKKFTLKVFGENENFESDVMTINMLHTIVQTYTN